LLRGPLSTRNEEDALIDRETKIKRKVVDLAEGILAYGNPKQIKAMDHAFANLMPNFVVPEKLARAIEEKLGN
jgi:hypothetical protein